jgi:hypothetical protein
MPKPAKADQTSKNEEMPDHAKTPLNPLIFVSHDNQDADLAEAFGKLITNVSAGVLKVFRSSDTKGTQGIEYGAEWYPTLMKKMESASDVVCLLTERSLNRPWILYEAGVAKGKLNSTVYGVALGIPLDRASTGPFAQFQNCDDNEESLTKLVTQLAQRMPGADPQHDAILMQVRLFKESVAKCLQKLETKKGEKESKKTEEASIPKLFEEIKVMFQDLPVRIEQRVLEKPSRRRVEPMMFMDSTRYLGRKYGDAVSLLILSSMVRDEMPWVYDLGIETYRAMKSGNVKRALTSLREFSDMVELTIRGPMREMLDISPDYVMLLRENFERINHHYMATHNVSLDLKAEENHE